MLERNLQLLVWQASDSVLGTSSSYCRLITGMNKIVNLNKHDIIVSVNGEETVFLPSGKVASISTREVTCEGVDNFPCVRVEYGEVVGLPDPEEGVFYIVNMIVLERGNRTDLVAPDTGPTALRFPDGPQKGQVRAVTRFKRKLQRQLRD